ncbi:MAG: AlbA family DNA-binding domain-containing protein [Bacteroidia bacterium]
MAQVTFSPLLSRIAQGEGLTLDFKQRIDSAAKIAKTLSAFANTAGGSLLIGVKDNGKIVGIQPEEEYYMIDLATRRFLRPSIPFEAEVHQHEEKYVLEIKIQPQLTLRPILAVEENVAQAYIRVGDQTRPASPFLRLLWEVEKKPLTLHYKYAEKCLFSYLKENSTIDEKTFLHILPPKLKKQARIVLAKLTAAKILEITLLPDREVFSLAPSVAPPGIEPGP